MTPSMPLTVLNEVPEHMAQECTGGRFPPGIRGILNEVPEHMAQEYACRHHGAARLTLLNEVPEHMAQELLRTPLIPRLCFFPQ